MMLHDHQVLMITRIVFTRVHVKRISMRLTLGFLHTFFTNILHIPQLNTGQLKNRTCVQIHSLQWQGQTRPILGLCSHNLSGILFFRNIWNVGGRRLFYQSHLFASYYSKWIVIPWNFYEMMHFCGKECWEMSNMVSPGQAGDLDL